MQEQLINCGVVKKKSHKANRNGQQNGGCFQVPMEVGLIYRHNLLYVT